MENRLIFCVTFIYGFQTVWKIMLVSMVLSAVEAEDGVRVRPLWERVGQNAELCKKKLSNIHMMYYLKFA